MGTHLTDTGQVWSPINTDTHSTTTHSTPRLALPTTSDKRGYAYLDTNMSVDFTLEKPGNLQGLSKVQEPEKLIMGDREVQGGSSDKCCAAVPMMPMVEKIISLPQYRFHPYQAPRQQCSDLHDGHLGEMQHRKQAMDTSSTDEKQADMLLHECREAIRQGAWKELNHVNKQQSNQQLMSSAFMYPTNVTANLTSPMSSRQESFCVRDKVRSPMVTPMHVYPVTAAYNPTPTLHEYFSGKPNAEICQPSEPGASKQFCQPRPLSSLTTTWSLKPKDDLAYSPIHDQADLCTGAVNLAHVQRKREEQPSAPPISWSCSHEPQIMHESASLTVTPRDIANNETKLATEEPLLQPSNGYGCLPYSHSLGSVPVHQQFAPIPTIPPWAYSTHYPCCMPIQPKPSVTPQAYQVVCREESGSAQQYPNALDMFKRANLLSGEGARRDVCPRVNRTRPMIVPNLLEVLSKFPQRNVIPVKLKVQDDTSTEEAQIKKPIQPKPSVTPQAYQVVCREESGSAQQYPNALDRVNLLSGEGACQDVRSRVNRTRPMIVPNLLEIMSKFPQRNVIPVKLKVQDDTSTEEAETKKDVRDAATSTDNKELVKGAAGISRDKVSKAKKTNQCTICKRFFSRSSAVKTHMRIHTGERPYKCPFCSCAFPQASSLQTHKRCHTGEKPYSCYECQSSFSHPSTLRTHMRTHTGEKPFQCTWQGCDKMFTDKSTLVKHQCVHTGEKPYTCSDCGVKFTQIGNMRKHRVKQHGAAIRGKKHTENCTESSPQDKISDQTSDP